MADTVELDNLSPTRKAESLGDAQTELRAEIEDGWTAAEGRASDQYRLHTDQLAAESPPRTDGKTDVEFEEGWMAQGGRTDNSREIGPESGADEETDIELEEGRAADGGRAGAEGSEDGPKSSTQDGLRIQPDDSEKPHISLCQVRHKNIIV